jgi:hypothetical protein
LNQNRGSILCFDAFSSREPVSTQHQVRGRLSLENALGSNAIRILVSESGCCEGSHDSEELPMQTITTIGLDIAKSR